MRRLSARARAVLSRSHPVVVEVVRHGPDGTPQGPVKVTSGSVTLDGEAAVRRAVTLETPDGDGWQVGSSVTVARGVRLRGLSLSVPLDLPSGTTGGDAVMDGGLLTLEDT